MLRGADIVQGMLDKAAAKGCEARNATELELSYLKRSVMATAATLKPNFTTESPSLSTSLWKWRAQSKVTLPIDWLCGKEFKNDQVGAVGAVNACAGVL